MNNQEHDIDTSETALAFDLITPDDFLKERDQERMIGVDVVTHVGALEHWPDELKDVIMARTTKRGTRVYAMDLAYNKETENISFTIAECLPKQVTAYCSRKIGTTFPDFCWLLSDGTTAENIGQVRTKFADDGEFGDLTWWLPAKFCDDVVEAMHIMNNFILEGNLFQAIMYGPRYS